MLEVGNESKLAICAMDCVKKGFKGLEFCFLQKQKSINRLKANGDFEF